MQTQDVLALAEVLVFSDLARASAPSLEKKLIDSVLRYRSEVIKDEGFLKEVAQQSPHALSKLLSEIHVEGDDALGHMNRKRRKMSWSHSLWSGADGLYPS